MFITTNAALQQFCSLVAHDDTLFIDTEFVRETTYYPILSLIQVAGADHEAVIDVMADGLDITTVLDLIYNPEAIKVLHAGKQDIEIFVQLRGAPPPNLFDTQIAATLLGLGEQVGYESLIRTISGKDVDKSQQHSRWGKRPLSPKQIDYALADVTYLREAYPLIVERLNALNRLHWVGEEVARLLADASLYEADPEAIWLRFKTKHNKPHYLARLKYLAAARERYAVDHNIARSRVMKDDLLHHLALSSPQDDEAYAQVKGIRAAKLPLDVVKKAIEQANALPASACPKRIRPSSALHGDELMRDVLRMLLKYCAQTHGIAASFICDKVALQAILDGDERALSGWRDELFGALVRGWMNGEYQLSMQDGLLVLNHIDNGSV